MATPTNKQKFMMYGGEILLEFFPNSHRYVINGQRKEGVTTILSRISKDALIPWAVNMSVNELRSRLTAVLDDGGVIDLDALEEAIKAAKIAHTQKKEAGADIGTLAHAAIETYIKTGRWEVPPGTESVMIQFKRWLDDYKPVFAECEMPVYSRQYDYCGTADAVALINGHQVMVDFKTSNPKKEYDSRKKRFTGKIRAYPEHILQCAAYDVASTEEINHTSELPLKSIDAHAVLYLPKDGSSYYYEVNDDTAANCQAFIALLTLHRRLKALT